MTGRFRLLFACPEPGCGQTRKARAYWSPRCPLGHGEMLGVDPRAAVALTALAPADRGARMVKRRVQMTSRWVRQYVCGVR